MSVLLSLSFSAVYLKVPSRASWSRIPKGAFAWGIVRRTVWFSVFVNMQLLSLGPQATPIQSMSEKGAWLMLRRQKHKDVDSRGSAHSPNPFSQSHCSTNQTAICKCQITLVRVACVCVCVCVCVIYLILTVAWPVFIKWGGDHPAQDWLWITSQTLWLQSFLVTVPCRRRM